MFIRSGSIAVSLSRSLVLVPILLLILCVTAQDLSFHHKKFIDKFEYETEGEETVLRAWHHYVVSRNAREQYMVRLFFPETGQITSLNTYADKDMRIKDGLSQAWYDDGRLVHSGRYEDDRKTGPWKELAGKYHEEGGYVDGLRHGLWKIPHRNGTDSGSYAMGQKEGLWYSLDDEGRITAIRPLVNGELEGEVIRYDHDAGTETRSTYSKGKLVGLEPEPEEEETGRFTLVERMPCYNNCGDVNSGPSCDECLIKFISSNLRFPAKARKQNISGRAFLTFVVDKDGSVKDVEVLNGVCQEIKEECLRLMGLMEHWEPGYQRDKAVSVQYNLPLKFTIR